MKKVNQLISTLVICLFFLSCGKADRREQAEKFDLSGESAPLYTYDKIKLNLGMILSSSTNPCELPFLLESTQVDYDPLLVNDLEGIHFNPSSEFDVALSLGIFTTDFAYLASFGNSDDAMDYLNHCKILADCLNISTAFDIELMKQMEDEIDNPEKLARVIHKEVRNVAKYLRGNYRSKSAILVLTGGFLEGLYVSAELVTNHYETQGPNQDCIPEILDLISDQQGSLNDVISMLISLEDNENFGDLTMELFELESILAVLDTKNQDLDSNDSWQLTLLKIREIRKGILKETIL